MIVATANPIVAVLNGIKNGVASFSIRRAWILKLLGNMSRVTGDTPALRGFPTANYVLCLDTGFRTDGSSVEERAFLHIPMNESQVATAFADVHSRFEKGGITEADVTKEVTGILTG